MDFKKVIGNFPKQFLWKPKLENARKLKGIHSYVVAGMGGSLLAADLLASWDNSLPLTLHNTYGPLPISQVALKKTLFIGSSYSGNTEEVVDALTKVLQKNIPSAVISTGGKLIRIAQKKSLPYIKLPSTGIQPRSAIGYSILALLKVLGKQKALKELAFLSSSLNVKAEKVEGEKLARTIRGKIPLIYASYQNRSLAYNWKIRMNESGKIPAFSNVFPELNHNEMMGFDYHPFARLFHAILITDTQDHARIILRMKLTENILKKKGILVTTVKLKGKSFWEKAFSCLMTADWTSYYTATRYGLKPEDETTIESFKKLLSKP